MTKVYEIDLTVDAPDWPEGKQWHWREQMLYSFPHGWSAVVALGLTQVQWQVLLALISHSDWGNRCRVTAASLGRELGLHRSTTLRALRTLVSHRLLIFEAVRGQRDQTIVLSPLLCWKGRPWHLSYARSQFLAAWHLHYATASVPVAPTASRHTAPAAVRL